MKKKLLCCFLSCVLLTVCFSTVIIANRAAVTVYGETERNETMIRLDEIEVSENGVTICNAEKYSLSFDFIPFDFIFYKFSNSQTNYYVADLTEEQTSVINISIESWRRAEFLNIAFFEHGKYFYYYDILHDDVFGNIRQNAIDSTELDSDIASVIFRQTDWYRRVDDRKEATTESFQGDMQQSKIWLDSYYRAKQTDEKVPRNKSRSISSTYAMDDPVVNIIPWYEFTKKGTKTGNKGALGYYVDTYEVPENSGRFLSEVIVWSNYVETPNFSSDYAIAETLPEFSGYYAYAEKGYPPMETPVDAIVACEGRSHLAIKNVYSKIEVVPYNSYSLNGTFVDRDEYIFGMSAVNGGKKFGTDTSLTGCVSTVAGIASLMALTIPFPGVSGALSTALGALSTAFAIADNLITINNGIKESFSVKENELSAYFIADRERHYILNGNKFVRAVDYQTSEDRYFGPSCHEDFYEQTVSTKFIAVLNNTGTELNATNKLKVVNSVDIIDIDFFALYPNKKNETFMQKASMTNEVYYSRAH